MGICDDKKICFILCVNNQHYLDEATYYINRLIIPEGYTIDMITITEAESMTSGYNEAMNATDAKYKIYMHQDVFIINQNFLFEMLDIFSNKSVGMIGLVGCFNFPENAIQWEGDSYGSLVLAGIKQSTLTIGALFSNKYEKAYSIDGLLMATQYDLPWREDLFNGWDFYDVSQSFEFRKHGYDVVVPRQDKAWAIHYDGCLNMKNYYKYRKLFLKEYAEML